ncbi:type II secretion system protein N [Marinobacter sp. 1_MG-2023]|uniref:type II secretion system protein N n=1 Tax=Marinobacter sp. 1_MG-2023 TaxID=3062627 RepID=UPI0026E2CB2F|nr:type II secretion system protein N [Marinobacter sp. 1_MG-2023]MDO6823335.1 type II secretion system protein N [Marinobacter sp. 1_MG-2023]
MSDAESKHFFRPGKVFLLLLLGVIVYLGALIVFIPAGWLWQQASPHISLPAQVQVKQVAGKVWDGAAGVVVAGFPVRVHWQLGWPSITALEQPVRISVESLQSAVSGDIALGWPANARLNARGNIAVAEFEELIRRSGGAMIEGDVSIDRLALEWADDRVVSADGLGRWAGGRVSWPMGDQTGQAQFPPMQANLDTTNGGVALVISEQSGSGPAADANIRWNGMMELRVYKRMIDLAGQPWSDSASPDDIVFRVRQPLLPGAR